MNRVQIRTYILDERIMIYGQTEYAVEFHFISIIRTKQLRANANDIIPITRDINVLKEIFLELEKETKSMGLFIHREKSKCMNTVLITRNKIFGKEIILELENEKTVRHFINSENPNS